MIGKTDQPSTDQKRIIEPTIPLPTIPLRLENRALREVLNSRSR